MNVSIKYPEFGKFLRELREKNSWSQEEAATKMGIPKPTWAGYEQGRRFPEEKDRENFIKKLSEVFNISVEEVKRKLPDKVMTTTEQIKHLQKEYAHHQKRTTELSTKLATDAGNSVKLVKELQEVTSRKERTRKNLEKAFMDLYPMRPVPVVSLPAVARYHATTGGPLDIIDIDPSDVKNIISVPEDHPANIALVVTGDSLIEAGIEDGNYALVNTKDTTPKNGDLVAVRLNGNEGTIKYYRKVNDSIYLYPANKNYKPIKLTEDMKPELIGVVKGIWKNTPPAPPEVWNNGSEEETTR